MQSKSLLVLIALVTLGSLCAVAQTPVATAPADVVDAPSWSILVTPAVVSQYMFRGVRLGGPSFQANVEADRGNLAVGVWASVPLKDRVPGQSNPEIDPYGSYKFTLSDSLSVQPGFTWYTYPKAAKENGFYRSTFEPSVALNYTVAGVTLTPKLYYDLGLKGPTAELNVAYAIPLKQLGTELDLLGTVGTFKWDDSLSIHNPDTKNYGDYWLVGVTVPYAIGQNVKLAAGFAYTQGSGNYLKTGTDPKNANPAAVGRGVATLSCAWTF
jgi:uncharacterized protein (TIGR02001 family)